MGINYGPCVCQRWGLVFCWWVSQEKHPTHPQEAIHHVYRQLTVPWRSSLQLYKIFPDGLSLASLHGVMETSLCLLCTVIVKPSYGWDTMNNIFFIFIGTFIRMFPWNIRCFHVRRGNAFRDIAEAAQLHQLSCTSSFVYHGNKLFKDID